jgi:prepilin-type N-terminal cleavage/methylation domain-containing protein
MSKFVKNNYCNENCPTAQLSNDSHLNFRLGLSAYLLEGGILNSYVDKIHSVRRVTIPKKSQVSFCDSLWGMRLGFTLVELLVVVAIIGILATLITAAAFRVMNTTRMTAVRMKINDIEMALEMYKNKFGEYPPMLGDKPAVARHIKKRWPRSTVTDIPTDNDKDTLVFWLGGFRNSDGKYCGFSVDKINPFNVNDGNPSDKFDNEVFIELNDDGVRSHTNSGSGIGEQKRITISMGSQVAPVVYFRGKRGGGANAYKNSDNEIWSESFTTFGKASPYLKEAGKWHNPETYQLIHPGADGNFGDTQLDKRITDGSKLGDGDYDNITNLGTSTLEAMLP